MRGSETSIFGNLLRRHRQAAGLSQEELAELARLSAVSVGALERGTRRAPYRETVALLANALALSEPAREEFEAAARQNRTPGDAPAESPTNLPSRLTSFVGRRREVAEIEALVRASRLVTVTGIGGIGKTSTALQVGAKLLPTWPDGVWLVRFAPLRDGTLVANAVAAAVGIRLPADGEPTQALSEALRGRSLLLIFDNCEHVVEGASALAAQLLAECPKLQVLASSREPLGIAGEETYRLPALELPLPLDSLEPQAARRFGAVALFVDRAVAVDKRFALGGDNVAAVVEICRRLDGIALAIELAAAHVRSLSPAELERRLDERFRLLTDGRRDALPHQQTLRAAMDWSYDLLEESERSLFRRLGVFAGGFTLEAAQAVSADLGCDDFDVLRLLTSLADKSLVGAFVSDESTRYDLLETTRLYALEKLTRCGEREACAARHLAYYRAAFERADVALEMTLQDDAILALSAELDNVRAALSWSIASGNLADGAALTFASGRLWLEKGLVHECLDRIESLIEACGDDGHPGAIASLWTSLAYLSGDSLRSARAFDAAAKALAAARRSGDPVTLHYRLLSYAVESARRLDVAAAAEALAEAEAIPNIEPTPRQRLRILNTRGLIAMQRDDIDGAAAAHVESLALARSVGAVYARLAATLNLAELEHQRGNTLRAIELAKEVAPEVAVRLEFYTMVTLLNNLAGYLIAVDDVAGARAAAVEAVGRLSRSDVGSGLMATALEHLALVQALEGRAEKAARIFGYCDTSYVSSGYVREYTERVTHERLKTLLRELLGEEQLQLLRDQGAAAAHEVIIEEATSSERVSNGRTG